MCSSRNICDGRNRSSRSSSSGSSCSGAHYALCALGVGLIALGVVMIVWTVIPMDGEDSSSSSASAGNNTSVPVPGNEEEKEEEDNGRTKSSSVALVLVGVGVGVLLLSICLGVRSKRRAQQRSSQSRPVEPYLDHVAGPQEEPVDPNTYNVPSYDEVVGSEDYPVRNSNLRQSTSQLPSYEDIIAAVENEGTQPTENSTVDTPLNQPTTGTDQTPARASSFNAPPSVPTRSTSRASRLLRPLRVRRIKSDKLHLKDFRLQIRSPTQNPVTIEPITPPPGYENKMPELQ